MRVIQTMNHAEMKSGHASPKRWSDLSTWLSLEAKIKTSVETLPDKLWACSYKWGSSTNHRHLGISLKRRNQLERKKRS